ncbi:Nucleotide-binding, alpha-beta plait [Niveomyces insectorum RCEF 264]|uniref:Nucleotide-binding, alpha-beta plait n=1 Tax=Niveomyces insectorum RCEF 264 TaxID=1081102 RepID=A0A167PGQ4_9HYPO|nr:Nucleotide-binding, alpha-beta plait [Niveomyces insectorum RCEF 264]
MAKTAIEFEKIIQTDRARKKNEVLAARIFKKDRRASAPVRGNGVTAAGKLATRAGVQKRVASTATAAPRAGNIHSEWAHDLHDNWRAASSGPGRGAASSSAAAAHTVSVARGTAGGRQQQQRRAAQLANAFNRGNLQPPQKPPPAKSGLAIRGIAAAVVDEPLVVMAQNFAPGTTAADIESAVTPVGGLVSSCRILKTTPLVIAELVFESREGAERVIATFNNQTADGRVLHVYAKTIVGGGGGGHTPTGPRAMTGGGSGSGQLVVDGSLGFDDPMDTDDFGHHAGPGPSAWNNSGKLYSDDLVGSRPAPREGYARSSRARGGRR